MRRSKILGLPAIYFLALIAGFPNGFVLPLLTNIHHEITRSYLYIALGEASFIFSIAFTGVVWGFILDWVENKERVLLADLELMAICILLVSIASDAWQYLLLRFLTGFFTSAIFAYIIILLSVEYQPGERIKTFLHFSALTSFFVGLGSGVAFFMSMIYYWRWIIRFYSLILGNMSKNCLVLLLCAFFLCHHAIIIGSV